MSLAHVLLLINAHNLVYFLIQNRNRGWLSVKITMRPAVVIINLYYITVLCPVVYRKLGDVADTDITNQIHAMLATPSSRPSTTTATASSRVLSSAKLTASLKSNSYMGRKITYPGNVLFGVQYIVPMWIEWHQQYYEEIFSRIVHIVENAAPCFLHNTHNLYPTQFIIYPISSFGMN